MSRVQYGSNRDSYWQRGCDDSKAGKPETWPTNGGGFDRPNVGYANGYRYGLLNAGGEAGEMPECGPGEADCALCNGRGVWGIPGARCSFCKGTGRVKFWRPRDDAAPKGEAGEMEAAKGDQE